MGWRNYSDFYKRFKEVYGLDYDSENEDHKKTKALYDLAFEDGWRGANNYDPLWDAD